MRRARAAAALLLAAAGCGGAHVVDRDEHPRLAPGEGLLALVAETNTQLQLTFCRDGGPCADLETLTTAHPMTVVVVPSGHWCMTKILAGVEGDLETEGAAIDHELTTDESPCFDVAAGVVTYPGDFIFTARGTSTMQERVTQGWEQDVDGLHAALRTRYPGIASMEVRASPARFPASTGGDDP